MISKRKAEVLVAGAGPVGLFAALQLSRQGLQVQVVDEEWRTTARSYALALHPSTLELMDEMGMAEELIAKGRRLERLVFCDSEGPRRRVEFSKLEGRFPFVLVLPQRALEAALVDRLKAEKVELDWNHRVERLEVGADSVAATIHRLSKEGAGYSISSSEWYVDKSLTRDYKFVVGADGHRSVVRRSLGIEFEDFGSPEVYAVFEFQADQDDSDEVAVVLDDGFTSVCWPLESGAYRWSFQLRSDQDFIDPRRKSRLAVQVGGRSYPHLDKERLLQLIEERAPWFRPAFKEMYWSLAIRFEHRLASSFGEGRAWLAGDAAHLASPVGVHSMNAGLQEGKQLASMIHGVLRHGDPFADMVKGESMRSARPSMEAYAESQRELWRCLLDIDCVPQAGPSADDFTRRNATRIPSCIPASGQHLQDLVGQLGLTLPKPAPASSS
ncbi:MAG TPA: NAD(P)/FAD-dependent oxidoreductase [Acidobacteriota bacterium]|nr:NAD(P)/FAD-dependent oxidoreductase [Acidobacteriota bacterium]